MPEKPVKHTSEELQVKLRSLVHKDLLDVFDKQFKTFTKVQITQMDKNTRQWGDYYYQSQRGSKQSWALEFVHNVNQAIPTFNEIFDEDTFYVFAAFIVVSTVLMAVFLARVVGVKIKERSLEVDREWRDPIPASFFSFPWQKSKTD